jgi:hypothetical protein
VLEDETEALDRLLETVGNVTEAAEEDAEMIETLDGETEALEDEDVMMAATELVRLAADE